MIITAIDYNKIPEGTPEEEIPTPGIYFNHIHYSTPESSGGAGGRNYDFYTTKLQLVGEIKQLDEKYLPDMKTINGESILGEGNIEVSVNLDSLNIKNSIGASSLQQVQDTGYTGIAIKTKNPNAYALDNTLTDNEPIGATGAFASSFGGVTSAQGKRSFAEGTNTIAKGKYSHAEGDNSVALGNDSHTEGLNCVSFGSGSHSEGGSTQAIGMHAHSEGVNTIAIGDASHTGGSGSTANGTHSFAHGNNVIAGYDNQFVVGRFNKNRSNSIFEVGLGSDDANRSTCFYISQDNGAAYSNFSNGYSPIYDPNRYATQSEVSQAITTEVPVIGGSTIFNAVVLRNGQSSALYDGCVALGVQTTASGNASAAFNSNTQATGNDSSAIGRQTIASGIASHSQGYVTQAKGDSSHSEGDNTIAEGIDSHAEGIGSYAKGAHSHAQGNNTQALADNSSAAGNRTIAGYANQFIVGKFNDNKSDTFFEIGNGADDSNRSNAFEVYADGHAEISVMGSTEKSVTTKKYVDDKIAEIPSGGGSITVDQTYNAESKNAQSGKAVAEAVEKKVDKLNLSKVETLDKFTNATKGLYISNNWNEGEARLAKLSYESEPNTVACRGGDGQIPVAMYGNDNNGNYKIWKGNAIPSDFFSYWFNYFLNGDLQTLKEKTKTLEEGAKLQNETIANKKITSAYNNRQLDWNSMYLLVSNTGEFDIEIRDSVSKSVVKDGDGNALPASRLCLLILPKEATKLDNNGTQGKLCMFVGITGKSINIASNFKAVQFSIKNNANLYLPDTCQVSTFKIGL